MMPFCTLLVEIQFGHGVCNVYDFTETNFENEEDCCMTATTGKVVYVVGKQKPDANKQPKADAKRIADAVARTAKYIKKGNHV